MSYVRVGFRCSCDYSVPEVLEDRTYGIDLDSTDNPNTGTKIAFDEDGDNLTIQITGLTPDVSGSPSNGSVNIDAETNTLSVDVSDELLESRRSRWVKPPYKFTQGVLHKYIKSVATASEGCVTDS